jgi:hypothetical protein
MVRYRKKKNRKLLEEADTFTRITAARRRMR